MPGTYALIGDIYDAAIDGVLWPGVVAGVARECVADKVMMSATDLLNPAQSLHVSHNIGLSVVQAWREGGYDIMEMELNTRWMRDVEHAVPSCSDDVFGGPEGFRQIAGPYYDMLERNGVRRQMLAKFEQGPYRIAGIGLNNWEPFSARSAGSLLQLAPHLRRALEIRRQLLAVKNENERLYQALDALPAGVVLLDVSEKIRYANPSARLQLEQHGGISVLSTGLRPHDLVLERRLKSLVRSAIRVSQREGDAQAGGVLALPAPAGGRALTFSVVPLSAMADYEELRHDQVAAALFISQINARHELPAAALSDLYCLTPREAQACLAFVNAGDLQMVSRELGVRLSTVRAMMKSIYEKTGQDSQAKLMRLLMEARPGFRHFD